MDTLSRVQNFDDKHELAGILTATTTLTSTNWAIRTKMTKKIGAMMVDTQQFLTQSTVLSQSSLRVSFMIPFQLSPVATRKSVKNAMPKFAKCACSPSPDESDCYEFGFQC